MSILDSVANSAACLTPVQENIPSELLSGRQFAFAKLPSKRPLSTRAPHGASSTDPATWDTLEDAIAAASKKTNTLIGRFCSAEDEFTCIDLDVVDSAKEPSKPEKWTTQAQLDRFTEIVREAVGLGAYVELSQSQKGVHIWLKSENGPALKTGVEIYSESRFIVTTGYAITDVRYSIDANNVATAEFTQATQKSESVGWGKSLVDKLKNEFTPKNKKAPATVSPLFPENHHPINHTKPQQDWPFLEMVFQFNNGQKTKAIFNGDTTTWHGGDHSVARFSLLQTLCKFSKDDSQVERCFYQSGLVREEVEVKRPELIRNDIRKARSLIAQDGSDQSEKIIRNRDGSTMFGGVVFGANLAGENRAFTPSQSKFTFHTADDLLNRPHPKWIVKGVVPDAGLFSIFGPSGSGKSFLALDMLAAISEGRGWFDHKCKSVPVAYVYFEGSGGVPQRIKAYSQKHGTPNIQFVQANAADLLNENDAEALTDALSDHMVRGGVVCIDTLSASSPSMDENSGQDMGRLISTFQTMQTNLGGLLMVIHHTGKEASKGLRGHSSLRASLDGSILVERIEDTATKQPSHIRRWAVDKSKDGSDGEWNTFQLEAMVLGEDEDGAPITSCVVTTGDVHPFAQNIMDSEFEKQDEMVFQFILNSHNDGECVSSSFIEKNRNAGLLDIPQKKCRAAISRLQHDGKIVHIKAGPSSRFEPTQTPQ